ncbi:MAG TPA: lipid biosynthesis B12-binding/radical SAM protein [Acidobacteriota bacterium]|nr:lipid biosynthesis B12-binding/radical SAM protein [Acidobacteriota bacterium]
MAKAVLVSANPTRFPFPIYPIGLGYIARACADAGHDATQLDIQLGGPEGLREWIAAARPDAVGLSIRNTDNCDSSDYASNVDYYAGLVQTIREVTDAPIVLGGSGFSLYPEALMLRTGADYGIRGEGEAAFVDLLSDLDAGRIPPRGRLYQSRRPNSPADFGAPLRPAQFVAHYLQFGGLMGVQSKRGCPFDCAYCSYPLLEGTLFRFREADDVVEEFLELIARDKASFIYFTDSVFNDPEDRFLKIAEGLARSGWEGKWTGFFRPRRGWRRDDIALLKRSGLECVEWGTDAGTDATLAGLKKGFDWEDVLESNNMFADQDIANGHFVIFGGPGETEASVAEGLSNLDGLRHSVVFAFLGIRIIPGTEVWRIAREEGLIADDWDSLRETFYFSPGLRREDVDAMIRRSFGGNICRIYPPAGGEALIAALHRRGLKGPLWDLVLKARRRTWS